MKARTVGRCRPKSSSNASRSPARARWSRSRVSSESGCTWVMLAFHLIIHCPNAGSCDRMGAIVCTKNTGAPWLKKEECHESYQDPGQSPEPVLLCHLYSVRPGRGQGHGGGATLQGQTAFRPRQVRSSVPALGLQL